MLFIVIYLIALKAHYGRVFSLPTELKIADPRRDAGGGAEMKDFFDVEDAPAAPQVSGEVVDAIIGDDGRNCGGGFRVLIGVAICPQ